jgi:UDP-3-O-[3-hydroxymyristoyl] N-acetylglucosamine deacetylase
LSGETTIEGRGLHSGAPARFRLSRRAGPVAIRVGAVAAEIHELTVVAGDRSTTVACGELRVRTVEHLFAALAALRVHRDLEIAIEGSEIPLADGGAAIFFDAIAALDIPASHPRLVIARDGRVQIRDSVYEFVRSERIEIEVQVDFGDPRLATRATWNGDPADFRAHIAIARTFGFAHEVDDLLARGLASHVAPESVVVVCEDRVLSAGRAFEADEPARHKLLDLVGDMYVHGGPPRGRVIATRPGHAATNEAMLAAIDSGLLVLG